MSDLTDQFSAILSNPEAQQNIRSMLSSLGLGGEEAKPQQQQQQGHREASPPDLSGLGAMLSGLGLGGAGGGAETSSAPSIDINMLMNVQRIFSKMNTNDKNVDLLRALKPHLHEPDRVDEAIRILQLVSVLPALGESGLFGGGFK